MGNDALLLLSVLFLWMLFSLLFYRIRDQCDMGWALEISTFESVVLLEVCLNGRCLRLCLPLSCFSPVLSLQVSHKHLVWDNVQTEELASALFNPSIQYLHTMFDVKKPED